MAQIANRRADELQAEITQFIDRVSHFFDPEAIEALARETEFVQRTSPLTGQLFLTIFTLGMSLYGTPTLNQLVGLLNVVLPELQLSREALHQRLNDQAGQFFEALLARAIQLEVPTAIDVAVLAALGRILLFDSTVLQLPATLAPYFRGSGGAASPAAIKILFGYDLKSTHFFYVLLNGTAADHLIKNDAIGEVGATDLVLSDLGYFGIPTLAEIEQREAFFLSRLRSDIAVYQRDAAGTLVEFDLETFLTRLTAPQTELTGYLQSADVTVHTRLIIERVPEAIKAERLRKINAKNKERGHQTTQRTKLLAGFNLHITNTPPEIMPMKVVRQFYSLRWQIELVCKNWKSNWQLAAGRGQRPARIKCLIYAKLLFIFVTTKIIRLATLYAWRTAQREVSEFQAAQHIKVVGHEWLRTIIHEPQRISTVLTTAFTFMVHHCLKSKSNQRTYPLEILTTIDALA